MGSEMCIRDSANPHAKRLAPLVDGDVPSPVNPPSGCRFHTRCSYAVARCSTDEPEMHEVFPGHHVACHLREVQQSRGSTELDGVALS